MSGQMAGIIRIYRKGLLRERLQCAGQNRFIQAHNNGIQHAIFVVGQCYMVAGFVTTEIEDIVIFDFLYVLLTLAEEIETVSILELLQ